MIVDLFSLIDNKLSFLFKIFLVKTIKTFTKRRTKLLFSKTTTKQSKTFWLWTLAVLLLFFGFCNFIFIYFLNGFLIVQEKRYSLYGLWSVLILWLILFIGYKLRYPFRIRIGVLWNGLYTILLFLGLVNKNMERWVRYFSDFLDTLCQLFILLLVTKLVFSNFYVFFYYKTIWIVFLLNLRLIGSFVRKVSLIYYIKFKCA